ncbi:YegP family protein [Phascolarctobacterium succinatutens]|uniref:YegP family protein n=1 Tax=Phascolarctobacterium succinatutens TaxID=626940 RepID=UPI003AB7A7F0
MGKFVISQAKNGVKFNLKAANGEVIASSQVYKDEKYCRKGIASVINNAPVAPIEDQTAEGFTPCKHPKFEVYKDKAGEFRFRLKATNGQIIATGEGYKAMAGCKRGIESIKKNVGRLQVQVEQNLSSNYISGIHLIKKSVEQFIRSVVA